MPQSQPRATGASPQGRQVPSRGATPAPRRRRQLPWAAIAGTFGAGLLFLVGLSLATLAWRKPAAAPPAAPAVVIVPSPSPPVPPPVVQVASTSTGFAEVRQLLNREPLSLTPPAPPARVKRAQEPPALALNLAVPAPALPIEAPPSPAEQEPPAAAPEVADIEAEAAEPPAVPKCQTCGTAVNFAASPREAAKQALQEEKLLFTLHVSGNFEDPGFT